MKNKLMAGLALGIGFGVVGAAGSLQAQGVLVFDSYYGTYSPSYTTSFSQQYNIQIDPNNSFVLGQFSGQAEILFSPLSINPTVYVSLSGIQLTTDNNVAQNTNIGPSTDFNTANYIPNYDAVFGYYTFGMKLTEPGGKTDYGWIEFDQTGSGPGQCETTITYFYNNAGGDVLAEDYTIVPEPSSAALLSVGALMAGSVSLWKRRQQKTGA